MSTLSRLGLGTVQFGLPYGVSNTAGQPTHDVVREVLQLAADKGIHLLDTAAGYGESEAALGACLPTAHPFKVITKTMHLKNGIMPVSAAMAGSLNRLKMPAVHGLLCHLAEDLLSDEGPELWNRMEEFRHLGRVQKLGSSVYTAEQIHALLDRYPIEIVQLPINVLDQRLAQDGTLQRLKDKGVEVHARSLFLQGLIFMQPADLNEKMQWASPFVTAFQAARQKTGLSPLALSLAYALNRPEIDVALVGVTTAAELQEIIETVENLPSELPDFSVFAQDNERLLNPALWNG